MRRSVEMEERIWPRSNALKKPTETRVARATCARESPRRVRKRRNFWPGSCGASAGAETTPCFLRTCTIAAGFSPRARRRKSARCNSRTSASVYMRYRLAVRCGDTSPRASQARRADEEILRRRATPEMRKSFCPLGISDGLEKFFLLDTDASFL